MFCCHFPGCNFSTPHKSKIDNHHLVPREIKKTKTTISLCKNHHALIYVPEATAGQHSIQTPDSITIIQIYKSSNGKTLHYRDYNNKEFLYFFETKEIVEF